MKKIEITQKIENLQDINLVIDIRYDIANKRILANVYSQKFKIKFMDGIEYIIKELYSNKSFKILLVDNIKKISEKQFNLAKKEFLNNIQYLNTFITENNFNINKEELLNQLA